LGVTGIIGKSRRSISNLAKDIWKNSISKFAVQQNAGPHQSDPVGKTLKLLVVASAKANFLDDWRKRRVTIAARMHCENQ